MPNSENIQLQIGVEGTLVAAISAHDPPQLETRLHTTRVRPLRRLSCANGRGDDDDGGLRAPKVKEACGRQPEGYKIFAQKAAGGVTFAESFTEKTPTISKALAWA